MHEFFGPNGPSQAVFENQGNSKLQSVNIFIRKIPIQIDNACVKMKPKRFKQCVRVFRVFVRNNIVIPMNVVCSILLKCLAKPYGELSFVTLHAPII